MRRTDLLGTSAQAHRTYVRMLRRMTVEERFDRVFELIEFGRSLRAAGVKWEAENRPQSDTNGQTQSS